MTRVGRSRIAALKPWLPVIAWAAVLFALSSIPGSRIPPMRTAFDDKIEHSLAYGVLGFLSYRALRQGTGLRAAGTILGSVLVTVAYGLSDEVHQLFVPQRSFEWLDLCADGFGGTIGALSGRLVDWLRTRRAA